MRLPKTERYDVTETWPAERLNGFQWRQLRALTRFAYHSLPFYAKLYHAAGVQPDALKKLEDFSRLPIVHKSDVTASRESGRGQLTGMESPQDDGPFTIGMTSGTTGTDFLHCSRRWRRYQGGRLLRAYWWAGLRPGMRMMLTVPAWHCWAAEESYLAQRLGVIGIVPWGTFLPRYAANLLDAIMDLAPEFVSMFLPMLYAIQAECRRRGLPLQEAFKSVRCVLVVGAPLTPASRRCLELELGTNVFIGAGTTEGLIAMECSQHRGYHIFVDTCYLEAVDPATGHPLPPGERGLLLLTAFNPHGTVYIRYDTGDLGRIVAEPCGCGRTWPLIEIHDRLANTFSVHSKNMLPYDVRLCLDEIPELIGVPFSVVRRAGGSLSLWLAIQRPSEATSGDLEGRLRMAVRQRLQVDVDVEWVEELPARWKGAPVIEETEWRGEARG